MHYIAKFDPDFELEPYIDWLNSNERKLAFAQTTSWDCPATYKIVLSLQEDQTNRIPDYFEYGSLNIISARFKELLENVASNIEFVPVVLMCGMDTFKFFALQVMQRIDAIDESRTDFLDKKFGLMTGIKKLELDSNRIKDENLFFLNDSYSVILLFSKCLSEKIIVSDIKGLRFFHINDYSDSSSIKKIKLSKQDASGTTSV